MPVEQIIISTPPSYVLQVEPLYCGYFGISHFVLFREDITSMGQLVFDYAESTKRATVISPHPRYSNYS